MPLFDAHRFAQCAVLGKGYFHIFRDGLRCAVEGSFQDFPCRPTVRRVVGEQGQADGFPLLHDFLSVAFVYK